MSPERMAGDALVGGKEAALGSLIARKYAQGDHLIDAGPEVGLFWASSIQHPSTLPVLSIQHARDVLAARGTERAGRIHFGDYALREPRDRWLPDDSLRASDLLPLGASIDEAIQHGFWRGST